MKVSFMIIGAQKCGTTSLAAQLAAHSQVCFSKTKEPGYFNKMKHWQSDISQYHSLYSPMNGQLCGEASTMYTFLPEYRDTHLRLYEYNPGLKLIYLMRQPVERIISHYAHGLVRGRVKLPPESAVLKDPVYINRSRYSVQITPYLETFGADHVLLIIFEEFIRNSMEVLDQVAAFLGISPADFLHADKSVKHPSVGERYMNDAGRQILSSPLAKAFRPVVPVFMRKAVRKYFSQELKEKPAFAPALKETLWQFLRDDVANIEKILKRRIDIWHEGYTG
jgi:hypothetical protein